MKDLEKNIIDAAEAYGDRQGSAIRVSRKHGFIDGAKSDAAKEYHTQGMYSEEEVLTLIKRHNSQMCELYWVESLDGEWFKDNKKKL